MDAAEYKHVVLGLIFLKSSPDASRHPLPLGEGRGAGAQHTHRSIDLLGRVYEHFLTRFARAKGKNGGQFYTPSCVVRRLVEMRGPCLLVRSDAQRSHAIQYITGTSGRQRVPSECFNTFRLAVPAPAIARRFDELTTRLMAKITFNSTKSRTLATLRYTLLPKLLSGELSVSAGTKEVSR
jgi:hypothetical protein